MVAVAISGIISAAIGHRLAPTMTIIDIPVSSYSLCVCVCVPLVQLLVSLWPVWLVGQCTWPALARHLNLHSTLHAPAMASIGIGIGISALLAGLMNLMSLIESH